jgi:hydrogenase/urease accessory protein HupE
MEFITFCIILIVIVLLGYVSFQGLDLRKPANWLFGIFGFFGGYISGLRIGINHNDAILLGTMIATLILVQGGTRHWHKLKYRTLARSMLSSNRESGNSSMFAKLVRKLLRKFK